MKIGIRDLEVWKEVVKFGWMSEVELYLKWWGEMASGGRGAGRRAGSRELIRRPWPAWAWPGGVGSLSGSERRRIKGTVSRVRGLCDPALRSKARRELGARFPAIEWRRGHPWGWVEREGVRVSSYTMKHDFDLGIYRAYAGRMGWRLETGPEFKSRMIEEAKKEGDRGGMVPDLVFPDPPDGVTIFELEEGTRGAPAFARKIEAIKRRYDAHQIDRVIFCVPSSKLGWYLDKVDRHKVGPDHYKSYRKWISVRSWGELLPLGQDVEKNLSGWVFGWRPEDDEVLDQWRKKNKARRMNAEKARQKLNI